MSKSGEKNAQLFSNFLYLGPNIQFARGQDSKGLWPVNNNALTPGWAFHFLNNFVWSVRDVHVCRSLGLNSFRRTLYQGENLLMPLPFKNQSIKQDRCPKSPLKATHFFLNGVLSE